MEEIILKDPLTGLYHHNYFIIKMNEEISRAKRKGEPVSLLFIDMDFFKMINDNFGHQVGDEVLKQFAVNLKSIVRESDLLFRYGGDEFTIILPDVSIDEAIKIAERIKYQLENEGYGPSKNLKISLSVGISQFPIDATTPEELIKKADERSLISKRTGRGKIVFGNEVQEEVKSLSLSELRIIGREREINLISKALSDFSTTGKKFILILKGVKGVGLTRLLEETLKLGKVLDLKTLSVKIGEKEAAEPFPLLKAIIRSLVLEQNFIPEDEVIKNVVNFFLPEFFSSKNTITITMNESKVLPVVGEMLFAFAGDERLLITIDNGHLLTSRCLLHLAQILKQDKNSQISLVMTSRTQSHILEGLKTVADEIRTLEIQPLMREEVKTILWQILRFEPDEEFLDWVMAKTGGRPLYIDKLLNALLISKKLIPGETKWILSDTYYTLSESIALPLAEEIHYLNPKEKEVLDFCAVYNIDFSTAFVAQALDLSVSETLEIFDNLARNGYIEEVIPYTIYRFSNPFVREVIYAQIPKEKRTKIHFKIAKILDENPEETSRLNPQVLYEHFINGGMESKAIPYIELLIKNSVKKREFKKAIRYIQRIFEIAEFKLQVSERIGLIRQMGMCLRCTGEYEEALNKLKIALDLAIRYNEKYEEALIRLEMAWIQHELELKTELLLNIEEILKIADQIKSNEIIAKAMIYKALYYQDFEKNVTKAILTYEEIIELIKEEENHEILSKIYGNLGKCYTQLKQHAKAKESFEIALYHARLCNNPEYLASIMLNYGTTQFIIQDVENSRITFEKTLELVKTENITHLLPHVLQNLAMIYSNYGEYAISISYLEKAVEYAREMKLELEELKYLLLLYGVRSYLGEHRYLASKLNEILEISKKTGNLNLLEKAVQYLVRIYTFLGDFNQLEQLLREVQNFKTPREKVLTEIQIFETLAVYSTNSANLFQSIERRRREAMDKHDFTSEIGFSTDLYLYKLITKDSVDIDLERLLEAANSIKLIRVYIDLLLFEILLGRNSKKYVQLLKNFEGKFNLKQKLLWEIGLNLMEISSKTKEDIENKVSELEKKFQEIESKYALNLLYRSLLNQPVVQETDLQDLYKNKLNNLVTDKLNFYV
uniref:Diguanylate cyclase n=1 Tax=candidate division CPR3 bacterium TaxID=2268181 RepID=A0A7V3J9Y0_UNCC3